MAIVTLDTFTGLIKNTNIFSALSVHLGFVTGSGQVKHGSTSFKTPQTLGQLKHCQSWPCPCHLLLPKVPQQHLAILSSANRFQKLEAELSILYFIKPSDFYLYYHQCNCLWSSPSLQFASRRSRASCYCGWILEGSVMVSVLCLESCCCCCCCGGCCCDWCCGWWDWVKVLCCSGKAAERMSWADWFPWSNLDV